MCAQRRLAGLFALWAGLVAGCSPPPTAPVTTSPQNRLATVYVVNYPLQYFAERIGGPHVRVVLPTPADEHPARWQPDAETIAAYQQADLILLNGASYANWTRTASLPASRVVDTTAAVRDRYIRLDDAVTHKHGFGNQRPNAPVAPTTWLDPQLALAQAEAIASALARLRPEQAAEFRENFAALESELRELDQQLTQAVAGGAPRAVYFSHPSYHYLARRTRLAGESVQWEPEAIPSPELWDELVVRLEQHPATWMIWERTPSGENVERLAALGLRSAVVAPCDNVPQESNFMDVMRQNIMNLQRVLADPP